MKTKLHILLIVLALLADVGEAAAQEAQFFRISGPAATTITSFNSDGTLVWSNTLPGTNYTIQTASSLTGGNNWVDYIQIPASNSINTNLLIAFNPPTGMTLIPAGSFMIGDTLDGEADAIPTNVYISAFYMDTNLVSYSQWLAVYNWATNNGYVLFQPGAGKAANHPVYYIDWYSSAKWCNARSQQAGLMPVYYTDADLTQVYTNSDTFAGDINGVTVYANWGANGYRLPTEAEWEKAARGGLSGQRFPWGNTISESQANYYGDTNDYSYDLGPYNGFNTNFNTGALPYTSPVGTFPANGYGLNDMAGNMTEWCWDWYAGPPYPIGSPYLGGTDPRGAATGSLHVMRGGYSSSYAFVARCAYRDSEPPTFFAPAIGFRCVRGL